MNTLIITLAEIGGEGLVNNLLVGFIILVCVIVIHAAGHWFIRSFAAGLPWALKVWQALFVIIGLIVFVNFLLGLVDRPFIRW